MQSKQFSIPQSLNWRTADDLGLTVLLESVLTLYLHDEIGLVTFVSHAWCHVLGFQETIFREHVIDFIFTVWFNRYTRIWLEDSTLSFRLGGVARSYSMIELGWHLEIYHVEDDDHLFLEA